MESIKKTYLEKELANYKKDEKNAILRHALVKNSLLSVASSQDDIKEMDFNFDINIKTLPAANQKASGRCWLFAATNVCREVIARKLNLANFELSQSYLAFYDRLEKSNYLLEAVIELINEEYDERTLAFLLQNGVGDGGQWDMFVNLVNKYECLSRNKYK